MKSKWKLSRRYSPSVTDFQADGFLFPDGLGDGGVFALPELLRVQRFGLPLVARFEQRVRAQQAADMIGAERRFHG